MARLIDADALKARMYKCVIIMPNGEKCMADRAIDTQPTVTAEPYKPEMSDADRKASEAWCEYCDHIEMCKWYPFSGCEFRQIGGKSLRSDLKKQTNADKIRGMTDEELAEFIDKVTDCCSDGWMCEKCPINTKGCDKEKFTAWLKMEVDQNDG